MSYTICLNGQLITLEERDTRALVRRLIRETRRHLWNRASGPFLHAHGRWRWHHQRRNEPIHWIIEAVGGADLPTETRVNQLKRRHDRLERNLSPGGILDFYDNFNAWQRDAASFRRSMRNYLNDFDAGGGRSVQVLTLTRNLSFMTLQGCALALTAGASSAASAAAVASQGVGTALVRSAATNFVVNEIQNGATRVGRSLAGEVLTTSDVQREIGLNALNSVSDAMLGQIIGRFLRPLKDALSRAALREIRSGRFVRGIGIDVASQSIDAAIANSLKALRPQDLRNVLRDIALSGSARECAQSTADNLMENRRFRELMERHLQQ